MDEECPAKAVLDLTDAGAAAGVGQPTRGVGDMNARAYPFKVGTFDCMAVADGTFTYAPPMFPPPAELLFVNAPREPRAQALAEEGLGPKQWQAWTSAYTCLMVNTGSSLVLIDTGAGGLGPETGRLVENLRTIGIEPGDIDHVLLTHGHPDHLGGNVDAEGNVVFSQARWHMSRIEWEFWTEGQAEEVLPEHGKDVLVGVAQRNLAPIKERVTLISGEQEIVPGIQVQPAPGHTPGHIVAAISSAGEELLCVADLVLHPIQVERPEWFAVFDLLPDQLVSSRRTLLDRAAQAKCLVMAFHLPFPGLGRVSAMGADWQWEPVVSA
jgi:glyoxylase-like metal-dependent hydrolase (beta-lactamase superfamily II)